MRRSWISCSSSLTGARAGDNIVGVARRGTRTDKEVEEARIPGAPDGLVIIPTYNERENIEEVIRRTFSLERDFDVLIVDDNSPDGTTGMVKALMSEFPGRLFLEERAAKLGLGTAYIHGFKWALQRDYGYVFEMDADLSHDPDDLVRLSDAAKEKSADLIIGSRYVTGINVVNWPMRRVLLSRFASAYVRGITRMRIRDATSGFLCYARNVLETIDLRQITFSGYAFQIEMKFAAWTLGFRILEIPITFTGRKLGKSKLGRGIIREAVLGVPALRWRGLTGKYRRRE